LNFFFIEKFAKSIERNQNLENNVSQAWMRKLGKKRGWGAGGSLA
jgi:hypothetical protein